LVRTLLPTPPPAPYTTPFRSGGIRTKIDVDTGIMSIGSASWAYENGSFKKFPRHPETGAQLEGVTVPGWSDVVESLLDVVRRFPDRKSTRLNSSHAKISYAVF